MLELLPIFSGAAFGVGSAREAARTPEAKRLLMWLRQQELDISSKEALLGWMSRAPVSARTQQFFLNHVYELPDLSGKCILGYTFSGMEPRHDCKPAAT